MAIALAGFFSAHVQLICENQTTIEASEKNNPVRRRRGGIGEAKVEKNPFDVGSDRNFEQVFGPNEWLWFLPLFTTSGDGVHYPTRF